MAEDLLAHVVSEVANYITWRAIFTDDIYSRGTTSITLAAVMPTASNGSSSLPDQLGEMSCSAREARFVPIIVDALVSPHVDNVEPCAEASCS